MSQKRLHIGRLLCGVSVLSLTTAFAQNIEVKAYKTRLSDVMESIGTQSKKKIVLNTDENPLVSFGSKEAPLADTLKKIENLYNFKFEIKGNEIVVSDKKDDKKGGRGIASTEDEAADTADMTPGEQRENGFRYRTINMNYQDPSKVVDRVKKIVGEEIKFIETDDKNKALVFYGDEQTYRLIRQIIDDLDVSPPQVLLSARIVEASNKFSRDLGVALSRQAGDNKGNFSTKTVSSGNFNFNYKFGIIDSTGLNATLAASESNGDAKTISNPQVLTSDDVAANLSSDITFSVKVNGASASSTGTSTTTTTTSSVQSFTAGLKLQVTPKVLRDGRIRLKVSVDNGEIDKANAVDGIPAIANTAIKTEMILRTGQTAAIAGLYRQQTSNTNDGVPLAMNVPLFGWLFKTNAKVNDKKEMIAFITPSLMETPSEKSINLNSPTPAYNSNFSAPSSR